MAVAVLAAGAATTLVPTASATAGQPSGGAAIASRPDSASAKRRTTADTNPIVASSLTQDGRRFVWRVRLARPFSPRAMTAAGRSLCLMIDRSGAAASRVCVAGRPHGGPQLVEQRAAAASAGAPQNLDATITRPSSRELSASFRSTRVDPKDRRLRWQAVSGPSTPTCGSSAGAGCGTPFPSAPKPLDVHAPQLVGCVPGAASEVSSGPTGRHEVALTFDDGPSGDPPAMAFVNLLANEHVPATFFEIGDQISQYDPTGATERAMLADGDMIGDHSWSHPQMTSLSPAAQASQIETTAAAIRQRTGFTPCLWRPPYGDVNAQLVSLARSLGMVTVMWNVDPTDWSTPGTPVIYQRVVSGTHDGAIVLQHFGGGPRGQTLAALPQEIATLRRQGYRFVTVTQLLGLRMIYR